MPLFSADWTPTLIARVRYRSTVGQARPAETVLRRASGVRFLAGVSLFLLVNAADGFFGLDQFAGQGAWRMSGLGQPVLTLSFWPWMALAFGTVGLTKVAERTAGMVSGHGYGPKARIKLFVACIAMALGGLVRSMIHPG